MNQRQTHFVDPKWEIIEYKTIQSIYRIHMSIFGISTMFACDYIYDIRAETSNNRKMFEKPIWTRWEKGCDKKKESQKEPGAQYADSI